MENKDKRKEADEKLRNEYGRVGREVLRIIEKSKENKSKEEIDER